MNEQVVSDCEPLIPFQQGGLRNSVWYPDGIFGESVEWNTPYAHYQYMGKVYGPNIPKYDENGNLIGFWSPPKKDPTGRPIKYHQAGTTDHWFEDAKRKHLHEWEKLVKDTMGKD